MNHSPFDQTYDDTSTAADAYPTSFSCSPIPCLSFPLTDSHEMPSYFTAPYSDTGWPYPEELSIEPSGNLPNRMPVEASTSFQPPDIDDLRPSDRRLAEFRGSLHCDINSANITEDEIWKLPSSTEITESKRSYDLSLCREPASHEDELTPSPTGARPSHESIVTQASDKPFGHVQATSSSRSQSPPKRRRSAMGRQSVPLKSQTAELQIENERVDRESEVRALAKSSHSIIERRYRENLNQKITQLDETLSNIRRPKDSGKSKIEEHPNKTRKAEVLNDAMRFIKQAELESGARNKEIDFLRLRVAALEKLVNCGDCALLKQYSDPQLDYTTDF